MIVGAQLTGLTRLDIPLMLGTLFTGDPDRARFYGFFLHLIMGQFLALFYAAGFAALGVASWWPGAGFGVVHAAVAGTLLVPLLPTVHPRMATERAGPTSKTLLEPPGASGSQLRVEHTSDHNGSSRRLWGNPGSIPPSAMMNRSQVPHR